MPKASPVAISLIVGLGNPGSQYEHTRHNVGVDFLNMLSEKYKIDMRPEKNFMGITGRGYIGDNEIRLLFPTTYMNESGRSVSALASFYKIKAENILVLHDDLDLPPGSMRLKRGGGLAGHNGLKSITACLGNNQNFYRLRFGIGKPPSHDVINWVLGRPDRQQHELIDTAMIKALMTMDTLFAQGLDKATAAINGFKPQLEE